MIINGLHITNVPTNNEQPSKLINLDINQNSNKLYMELMPWKKLQVHLDIPNIVQHCSVMMP